jgi:hypothetical protein
MDTTSTLSADYEDFRKTFTSTIKTTVDVNFVGRKRAHLKHRWEAAINESNDAKKSISKFPIIAEQASQALEKVEAEYKSVRKEDQFAQEAEHQASARCIQALLSIIDKKNAKNAALDQRITALETRNTENSTLLQRVLALEQRDSGQSTLLQRMMTLDKELAELRARKSSTEPTSFQVTPATQSQLQSFFDGRVSELTRQFNTLRENQLAVPSANELRNMSQRVSSVHQRVTDVEKAYSSIGQDIRTRFEDVELKVSSQRSDHVDARNNLQQQIIDIRESQRITDNTTAGKVNEAIDSLKADIARLKESVGDVASKVANSPESHPELDQVVDELDKFKENINTKVDDLTSDLNNYKTTTNSTLNVLKEDVSTAKAQTKARDASAYQTTEFVLMKQDIKDFRSTIYQSSKRLDNLESSQDKFSDEVKELKDLKRAPILRELAKQVTNEQMKPLRQDVENMSNRISALATKSAKDTKDLDSRLEAVASDQVRIQEHLDSGPKTIKGEVSRLAENHRASSQDRSNAPTAPSTADQAQLQGKLDAGFKTLRAEFTKLSDAQWTSEEKRSRVLNLAFDAVKDEQKNLRLTIDAIKAEQFSRRDDLRTCKIMVDKTAHILTGLNHRVNNITTDSLARQMTGVANKALVKYEKDLRKAERDIYVLQQAAEKLTGTIDELQTRPVASAAPTSPTASTALADLQKQVNRNRANHETLTSNVEKEKTQIEERLISLEKWSVEQKDKPTDSDPRVDRKNTRHALENLRSDLTKLEQKVKQIGTTDKESDLWDIEATNGLSCGPKPTPSTSAPAKPTKVRLTNDTIPVNRSSPARPTDESAESPPRRTISDDDSDVDEIASSSAPEKATKTAGEKLLLQFQNPNGIGNGNASKSSSSSSSSKSASQLPSSLPLQPSRKRQREREEPVDAVNKQPKRSLGRPRKTRN